MFKFWRRVWGWGGWDFPSSSPICYICSSFIPLPPPPTPHAWEVLHNLSILVPCSEADLPGPRMGIWNTPTNNPSKTQNWSVSGFSTLIFRRSWKMTGTENKVWGLIEYCDYKHFNTRLFWKYNCPLFWNICNSENHAFFHNYPLNSTQLSSPNPYTNFLKSLNLMTEWKHISQHPVHFTAFDFRIVWVDCRQYSCLKGVPSWVAFHVLTCDPSQP